MRAARHRLFGILGSCIAGLTLVVLSPDESLQDERACTQFIETAVRERLHAFWECRRNIYYVLSRERGRKCI